MHKNLLQPTKKQAVHCGHNMFLVAIFSQMATETAVFVILSNKNRILKKWANIKEPRILYESNNQQHDHLTKKKQL